MTVMASGEWDINDGMTAYAEVLLNRRTNKVNGYRQFWTYQYLLTYGYGYTYGDPLALSEGWDLLQDGFHYVGFSPTAITDRDDEEVSIDYTRFVAGLRGDVFDLPGWTWEISTQFSRSSGDYSEDIIWNDAVAGEWFRNNLCAGEVSDYRGVPCVDVNWYTPSFLAGDIPANEAAFLFGNVTGNTVFEQISTEAYITGDLFSLPAGPVGGVFGLFYQDDRINDVPSQAMQDGELWGDSQAGITTGNDDTRAAFVELGIPLFRDVPFAKSMDISLSARYTDVASYGGADTWKAGLNWAVTPEFRIRASQGTSFRSPSLFELYLSGETSFARQSLDPCVAWANNLALGNITQRIADNCAASGIGPTQLSGGGATMTVLSSGGKGLLEAETAESRTLGFVWSPDGIDLQVSVDYFDIQVSGEVSKLGAGQILRGCYDSPSFPTDPLCSLFIRNPTTPGTPGLGLINTVRNDFINIASQGNAGIDFEARYRHELPWGDLIVDAQASRQIEDNFQLLPGSPAENFNGESGEPQWVGNLNFTFESGPWSAFWGIRYVDATSNVEPYTEANGTNWTFLYQPANFKLYTEPMYYHNISVAYEFPWDVTGRLGVSNVLDEEPPIVSSNAGYARLGNAVIESQYDLLGRTVFVNFTKKF
jgi:iron complex outermembrane receptor protein